MTRERNNTGEIEHLISMLEKSPEEQRSQLLLLIEANEPTKAALLRARLLTVERVLMLDQESLGRVLEDASEIHIANSLRGIDLELRQRALDLVSKEKRKQVIKLIQLPSPEPAEIQSSRRQLISRVRELEHRGAIHLGSLVKQGTNLKKTA